MAYRRGRRRRPSSTPRYDITPTSSTSADIGCTYTNPNGFTLHDIGTPENMTAWLVGTGGKSANQTQWQNGCDGGTRWHGGLATYESLLDAARNGLIPDADAVPTEPESEWLPDSLQTTMAQQRRWGENGTHLGWNGPAVWGNLPKYRLVRRRQEAEAPVVRLVVSGAMSAGIPAARAIERAAAVCGVVRDLQATGRGVEVWLDISCTGGSKGNHAPRLLVKGADEAVDTSRLFFWLGHPAATRGILYPFITQQLNGGCEENRNDIWGQASPTNPVRREGDENAVFVPCMSWDSAGTWKDALRTLVLRHFNTAAPTEE